MAAALVAGLLVALLASSSPAAPAGFPDVPATHPYYQAINDLAARGIIGGYTDGTFGPGDVVKRQQFAKMIVLAAGYPVSEANVCPFTDVPKGGPGTLFPDNYIAVCAARGVTTGKTATNFDPYGNITRLQVVSMVVRAADGLRPGLLAAPPASWSGDATWAADPVHGVNAARAEYNGLLGGLTLAALDPRGNMTRGEVAQVLFNLLDLLARPTGPTTVSLTLGVGGGNGTLSVSPDQTTYKRGDSVTITAAPASGYVFAGWGGTGLGSADPYLNPLIIVLTGDTAITASFQEPNGEFEDLGGPITSAPAACSRAYGLLDVFARGRNGSLVHKSWNGLDWSSWEDLGGSVKAGSDPAVASWGADRLDVFARGGDDALWHMSWDGSSWSGWESLGGQLGASPTVAYHNVGSTQKYLEVFVVDSQGRLLQRTFDGEAWGDWTEMSLDLTTPMPGVAPTAVTWGSVRVDLFVRGANGGDWHTFLAPGSRWYPWEDTGGGVVSRISASAWGSWAENQLDLFAQGADGGLWHRDMVSGLWTPWRTLRVGAIASAPAAVSYAPERVDVFVRGTDGGLWHKVYKGYSWLQ
jgi:hypothetical protein